MGGSTYSPIGSASDVQMVNPDQYAKMNSLLQGQVGQYGSQMQGSLGQASSMLGQIGSLSGNYDNLIKQMTGGYGQQGLVGKLGQIGESYDPNAGMNLFLSQQPQLQGVAESMARNSLSEYGQNAQELARETSRASLSDTASQLAASGLLGAGAGTTAMTRAALAPQLEAATQLAQMRSGFLGQVGGQLASQGLAGAQSAYDAQQQMAMQGVLGQMQGLQGAGGLLGNQISGLGGVAQGYAGLGSTYGNLLGNATGSLAQLNQPEYWQPQYAKNPGFYDYAAMAAPIVGSLLGGPLGGAAGTGLAALLSGAGGGAPTTPNYFQNSGGWNSGNR